MSGSADLAEEGRATAVRLRAHLRRGGWTAWTEVPCVGGPTVGYSSGRMDVWAIKERFGNGYTAAFEVKVSRQDFLHDVQTDKWLKYRPYARRFYYAVPQGLVSKADLPVGVGLVVEYPGRPAQGQKKEVKRHWRVVRHPHANPDYVLTGEFMLMMLRRGLEDEREIRDLRARHAFEGNRELASVAYTVGHNIGVRLAQAERVLAAGGKADTPEAYRAERALRFVEAIEDTLASMGIDREAWGGYDPERRAQFISALILHAEQVRKIGGYLTRLPTMMNGEVEKLVHDLR